MYRLNEEIVLELIDQTAGNVSAIARACQVCRSSVISFIERRPHLLQAVRDARAAMLDEARSQLAAQVAQGKQWAIKYALRNAGPDEFGRENDQPGPKLTNAERLELLQELVESMKKEQSQNAANTSTAATPGPTQSGFPAPRAAGQQKPTDYNTLQQRPAPGAAPRAMCSPTVAPAQSQMFRQPPSAHEMRQQWFPHGETPIFDEGREPTMAASAGDRSPNPQCPTDDDSILQQYAPPVAPRAAEHGNEGGADRVSPDNQPPGQRRSTQDDSILEQYAPPVAPRATDERGPENASEGRAVELGQPGQIALLRPTIPR